jgi:hypothetical protein
VEQDAHPPHVLEPRKRLWQLLRAERVHVKVRRQLAAQLDPLRGHVQFVTALRKRPDEAVGNESVAMWQVVG